MIEARAFQIDDIESVIACLRRNYPWMQERSNHYLQTWIKPLYKHTWDEKEDGLPQYRYGKVLVDNGEIVGYFGAIGTRRLVNNKEVSVLNLTTWAVDKEYRARFIPYVEDMYYSADIILDLTPNYSSRLMERSFFGMELYEDTLIKLYPIPYEGKKRIIIENDLSSLRVNNGKLYNEYKDNCEHGVKLIKVSVQRDECFIFYKIVPNREPNRIRILSVTYPKVFTDYCHEICWNLFQIEGIFADYNRLSMDRIAEERLKPCIECDKLFFGENEIKYPTYGEREVHRLIKNNMSKTFSNIDYLYTEFAFII